MGLVRIYLIYTRTKLNLGLDGETGIIRVLLVIFDDGLLLEQVLYKVYHCVASTCIAYFLIPLAESLDKLLVPQIVCSGKCDLQCLTVLLFV